MLSTGFCGNKTKLKKAVDKLKDFSTATKPVGMSLQKRVLGVKEVTRTLPPTLLRLSGMVNRRLNSDEAKRAANIFLGSMPMVYYFVTYLYFKCTVGRDGWSGESLTNTNTGLNNFMLQMDFTTGQLSGLSGSAIAKLLEDEPNGFDGLKIVDRTENSYEAFLNNLKKEYGESKITNAMQCPLYTLYRAAKAYLQSKFQNQKGDANLEEIKNRLKKFKRACKAEQYFEDEFNKFLTEIHLPTSNSSHSSGTSDEDSPSTAGSIAGTLTAFGLGGGGAAAYLFNLGSAKNLAFIRPWRPFSCDSPSNLKEAIDWILRVTGKDGRGGGGNGTAIAALAEQVKKLLTDVQLSNSGLSHQDFENVKQALDGSGSGHGLIAKLAEGLQQFIGYKGETFSGSSNTTGQITGAGIAPSNIATHRLCDAAIAFTIAVLEGCKKKVKQPYQTKLDGVITKLHEKYGYGPDGLKGVSGEIQSELTGSWGQVNQFVVDLKNAFQTNFSSGLGVDADAVAGKVGDYLKGVFQGNGGSGWDSSGADGVEQKLKTLVQNFNGNNTYNTSAGGFSDNIGQVKNALNTGSHATVQPILEAGKEEFVWHLEKAYVSYYPASAQWPSDGNDEKTCAQIFLGCIPLIYHCLTQLYWLCHDSGPWAEHRFHDPNGSGLRNIMVALGYSDYYLSSQQGTLVVKSAMQRFNEFTAIQLEGPKPQLTTPYHAFLNKLTSNLETVTNPPSSNLTDQTIPALYHIARLYCRHQHGRNADRTRPPSSIREMLYWLSGLQFSPQYDSLQSHISGVFRNILGKPGITDDTQLSLDVADSASYKNDNTLSAVDLKGYLTMTCLYSPMVLGRLQGPGVSTESKEPYLHFLFGNGMTFAYPSGAALLTKLSEYAYALQFQLSFLTQKSFTNFDEGCGWRHCRFGKEIEPTESSNVTAPSHLCHADCESHTRGECQHKGPSSTNCGSQGKASPLQSFLTDNLHGFRRGQPGTSDHLASCSSNSMCHVPMGFKAECLRETPGYGYHVFYPLLFYCSDHTRPLRLLSDKLHCISNYTPRSLGDMLGFYLHLCLQVFNKRSADLSSYITTLLTTQRHPSRAGLLVFEYLENSIVELGSALHGVVRHCHNKQKGVKDDAIKHQTVSGGSCSHSDSSPADLWSLFALVDNQSKYPNCYGPSQNCGAYLSPLTRSKGSTFGKSATFASTYLSWVSYLADDFKERLEALLTDFRNITCTECRTKNGGTCNCTNGNHGTNSCQCDSVVSCSGVLPLFYEHGFNFFNVKSLSGKVNGHGGTKRTCANFHEQLQNVINGDPLYTLLGAVDRFLYAIRRAFLSKLSAFWTIYTCLILYTFFFLLDTLHLRSHLKLTSAHMLPPLALLTSGNPLPITKLAYIGQ
ncbi:variant erythrocyte surface antigen-1 family protein [Babesia caballi]|uniref:Variant erythrocyte surface antigen-1 family protein n=1 Tax=Babesia caballi TaxID=5871 RepID=A0AAV4LSF1_BABCB|nr:variant erythrocyte surface antigen-1 family protein [Babesia caballi]